jgi:prephenate dehydrogenase
VTRIKKLSILGVGLLGGSVGLAARSRLSGCRVAGYGHRAATLQTALQIGAIDEAYASPSDAVRGADLIVLCTPVSLLADLVRQIGPSLRDGAIVTDVGSTKRSIVEAAEQSLPKTVHFVGSHPMAGSEKRGVEFARTDLFDKALCILTPTARTNPTALAEVDAFWQALGMHTLSITPDEHDRLLATISHLPHALAAALIAMQDDAAMPLAGKGFLDATRIAGGDGALWRDILQDNRDSMRSALARLRKELDHLDTLLDPNRSEELAAWLNAAAARREALLRQKLQEVTPD